MDQLTTKSTSSVTADIVEDFIIDETATTRRIFRAMIVENRKDPQASVRGTIIHQRKSRTGQWEGTSEIKLSQLKSGEGIKLELSSGELKRFFEFLQEAYAIGSKGVSYGTQELVVGRADTMIEVSSDRKHLIQELIRKEFTTEIWDELISADPDLATKLALAKVQKDRISALQEFESNIDKGLDENYWQEFFFRHQWIFGYGLNYQFLHLLQDQPIYGGVKVSGRGGQKGDYLMHTTGQNRFTVLVEIKKPGTNLFFHHKDGTTANYRNGVPHANPELTGAISQIQVNCNTWESEGARTPQNAEELLQAKIFTHKPRGILVIGCTKELDSFEKRTAFEIFRQNLQNPEIITFDELLERARFIVNKHPDGDS